MLNANDFPYKYLEDLGIPIKYRIDLDSVNSNLKIDHCVGKDYFVVLTNFTIVNVYDKASGEIITQKAVFTEEEMLEGGGQFKIALEADQLFISSGDLLYILNLPLLEESRIINQLPGINDINITDVSLDGKWLLYSVLLSSDSNWHRVAKNAYNIETEQLKLYGYGDLRQWNGNMINTNISQGSFLSSHGQFLVQQFGYKGDIYGNIHITDQESDMDIIQIDSLIGFQTLYRYKDNILFSSAERNGDNEYSVYSNIVKGSADQNLIRVKSPNNAIIQIAHSDEIVYASTRTSYLSDEVVIHQYDIDENMLKENFILSYNNEKLLEYVMSMLRMPYDQGLIFEFRESNEIEGQKQELVVYEVESHSVLFDKLKTITSVNLDTAYKISVYPNPGMEKITISPANGILETDIQIVNLQGVKVEALAVRFVENSVEVDINNLPNGSYIIQVAEQSKMFSKGS